MLHFLQAPKKWNAGKYLTAGSGARDQKGIFQFPWYNYSHHGLFQAVSIMPVKVMLERDVYNWLFEACASWQ